MSVATVRIAPVERWCEDILSDWCEPEKKIWPGTPVTILPRTMRKQKTLPNCDGHEWQLEPESAKKLRTAIGKEYFERDWWICEHMLEMD